jgi:exosortase
VPSRQFRKSDGVISEGDNVSVKCGMTAVGSTMAISILKWLVAPLLVVLYMPTVLWLWDRWTLSVWHNAHGFLIFLVIIYLVSKELRRLKDLPVSSSAWGFLILVPALALHALDAGMHTQILSAIALVLTLPGLALLFLGVPRTKAIGFPLVFMFFTLPIPLALTEHLHLVLRKIATLGTAYVVPKLGVPLYVEGTTLYIPRGVLQVADACSGFSTLYAAVAVACLVAYTCPDPQRRVLVLLAAVPLAIGANIIRVILLVLLVQWQGLGILGTSWHTTSGLFTFALALPVIFWIGNVPAKEKDDK